MKGWGIGLLLMGALMAFLALMMDTTVYTPGVPSIGGYGGIDPSRTHNLGQLQLQELLFVGGCTLFLAGAVLASAGRIVEVLSQSGVGLIAPGGVGAVETDGERHARFTREDDDRTRVWLSIAAVVAILGSMVWWVATREPSSEAAVIDANVAATTNALEAEADRLGALTNGQGGAR